MNNYIANHQESTTDHEIESFVSSVTLLYMDSDTWAHELL